MVSLPPEVSFAVLLGALSALNEVLQMIPFWWRLFFVIASMLVVADLCLRSAFIKRHFREPLVRVVLSTGIFLLIELLFWTPMRRQYMQELRTRLVLRLAPRPYRQRVLCVIRGDRR